MDENNVLTYEEIANAWVDKWQQVFDEHAEQEKGFDLPASEFPEDDDLINMILDNIALQGQFSSMYDEEDDCYRFAYCFYE